MVVFYRGPCVRITHEVFETWCPSYRSFPLRELRGLCVVERAAPSTAIRSLRTALISAAGTIGLVAGLAWVAGWRTLLSLAAMTVAVLLAMALLISIAYRTPPLAWELVGVYRGQPVQLFRAIDAKTIGEVRRALVRALDRLDEGVPNLPTWIHRQ